MVVDSEPHRAPDRRSLTRRRRRRDPHAGNRAGDPAGAELRGAFDGRRDRPGVADLDVLGPYADRDLRSDVSREPAAPRAEPHQLTASRILPLQPDAPLLACGTSFYGALASNGNLFLFRSESDLSARNVK